jgi:DNA-binding NarL/FixJ family response regulator
MPTTLELEPAGSAGTRRGVHLNLVLIDDHAILRDGHRLLLAAERDFRVVGEAGTVAEGVDLARLLLPDVVIMDISFPNGSGIEAIGALRREGEAMRIVVLTVHNTQECLRAAMRAGAHGFVAKDATYDVLVAAIRSAIALEEQTISPSPSAGVRGSLTVRKHGVLQQLTARERQVLVGVAQGYTSRQIAANMQRSVRTVVKHRANMMRKLSLHDASAVTRFAIANGLLTL